MVEIIYDFTYEGATTYGCIKECDTEAEAREWVEERRDDPYLGGFEIITREVE